MDKNVEMIDALVFGDLVRVFLEIEGCRNVELRLTIEKGDLIDEVSSVYFVNQVILVDGEFK